MPRKTASHSDDTAGNGGAVRMVCMYICSFQSSLEVGGGTRLQRRRRSLAQEEQQQLLLQMVADAQSQMEEMQSPTHGPQLPDAQWDSAGSGGNGSNGGGSFKSAGGGSRIGSRGGGGSIGGSGGGSDAGSNGPSPRAKNLLLDRVPRGSVGSVASVASCGNNDEFGAPLALPPGRGSTSPMRRHACFVNPNKSSSFVCMVSPR